MRSRRWRKRIVRRLVCGQLPQRPYPGAMPDTILTPTDVAAGLKAPERENRELRQANEILRKASAYFAQAELDRRFKP